MASSSLAPVRAGSATGSFWHTLGRFAEGLAFFLLLALVLYAPLARGSLDVNGLFGFRVLAALALGLTGVAAALRGRLYLPPPVVTVFFAGFLGLYAVSATLSPNAFGAEGALLNTLSQAAGFVLAAALVRGRRRRNVFLAALLASALAMGVYGVMQALGYGFTATLFDVVPPISSFYYNRIHYAGFLDLAALAALGLTLFGPFWWIRLGSGLLALLLYVNLGLTFSDAGWVATGLSTLALLIFWTVRASARRRWVRIGTVTMLFCVGVAGAGTFLYYSPEFAGTLEQKILILQGRTVEGTPNHTGLGGLYSRLAIHQGTLQLVKEQPWFGVGPGNFVYAFSEWRPPTATDGYISAQLHRFVNYAHNDYLQVASEAGVPAALLFTMFWLSVLVSSRFVPSSLTGLSYGLAALLLHGLVDGNLTVNHAVAFLAFATAGVIVSFRSTTGSVTGGPE